MVMGSPLPFRQRRTAPCLDCVLGVNGTPHTRGVPHCPQPRDRQKRPGTGRARYHGLVNAVLMARLTIAPAAAARVGQEGKPGIRLWSDATWAKVADANLVRPDRCAVII